MESNSVYNRMSCDQQNGTTQGLRKDKKLVVAENLRKRIGLGEHLKYIKLLSKIFLLAYSRELSK